ncbi:MAG: 23S rRNA (pseudouridine(1915)-N(3))-methyltransferase RlmH [Candidatus Woesearchaeota archaeon]
MPEILVFEKVKAPWIKEGLDYYCKRTKTKVIHIKNLPQDTQNCILLSEDGKKISSKELSKLVQPNTRFIIGPTDGFTKEQKHKKTIISLSKMTFTHEMATLFLAEQLYRAKMIHENRPYHRE